MHSQLITHLNFAKGFRGGERQTLLLIKALSTNGYLQKLFVRKNSELGKRAKEVKNLTIIEITKPYIFNLSLIKESSLLHAHETKGAQFAFFAHMFYKIPYIITRRVDNPIKNNFFTKQMYLKAFTTVALSYAIEKEIHKIDTAIKTTIIPSSYSALKVNQNAVTQIQQRFNKKILVGNIGELDNSHKGQYYLIEAAKTLEKKYPDLHFIFLGKGKDLQNYLIQAEGMSNITFEGFVNNVGDYIASLDFFVFPSLNEGLGSILLDVIQANIPIIASNIGGIPDIIKDMQTGILVETKNSEKIAEAIELLMQDQTLANKLATNAKKTIENFSITAMSQKYIKLYKEIEK